MIYMGLTPIILKYTNMRDKYVFFILNFSRGLWQVWT